MGANREHPLGRGLLTGAIADPSQLASGDSGGAGYFPRFGAEALSANLRLVERVTELARAKDVTPAQLALAWVPAQGDDVVPIPGTRRVRYLEQNVGALDVRIDGHNLAALEAAVPRDAVVGARYGDMSHIDA